MSTYWNRYGGGMYKVILRFITDDEEAKKILQDVYVILCHARPALKSPEHICVFLLLLCRKFCLENLGIGDGHELDVRMYVELADYLNNWLSTLPEDIRKTIQLYFMEGFEHEGRWRRKKNNSAIPKIAMLGYLTLQAAIEFKFPGCMLFRIEEYEQQERPAIDPI